MLPALVLTAGLGTRLDPLTRLIAKPAVPLAGRTLIERLLGWLAASDVREVVLNLHHHPASLTAVVGDGRHLGLRVRYSWEPRILGSAGGPKHALPLLEADTFLLVNGDTLCDVDLAAMVEAHASSGADVTLAVIPNPDPDRYNGIVLDEAGCVTAFVPRGTAAGTWHFTGVQVVAAAVFAALPDGEPVETVAGCYRDLVARDPGRLRGHRVGRPFVDAGTPRDYLAAALSLAGAAAGAAIEPGARVAPSARIRQSIVWAGAAVGDAAELHRCIVTDVSVPAGFTARDRVVVPADIARPDDPAEIAGDLALFPLR